jgi:hypothetical protein
MKIYGTYHNFQNDFIALDAKRQELQIHFHLSEPDLSNLLYTSYKKLTSDQLVQFQKAVYFQNKQEADAFGHVLLRLLADVRQNHEHQVDFVVLEQLVKQMRIQPHSNEDPNIKRVMTIKCQLLEKKCLREDERVPVEKSAKTEL